MSASNNDSLDSFDSSERAQKRTFVLLVALTGVLLLLGLTVLYVVPYYGFRAIHPMMPMIFGIAMGLVGGVALLGLALIGSISFVGHDVPFSQKLRSLAIKVLLPVLVVVGKLAGLQRERVQHAFVSVNNELVLARFRNGTRPRRILLLTPHCLQDRDCKVKITYRVENCKLCGNCPIKDLREMADKYGADLAVATGGTIARRIVKEKRPELIIAIACERDLTSGIQDTTPLPVYGIFNVRPYGPCMNTQVPLEKVESVLKEMTTAEARRQEPS